MRQLDDGWVSFCERIDGSCIEARVQGHQATLRTTTDPDYMLVATRDELRDFVAAAKRGELDGLLA